MHFANTICVQFCYPKNLITYLLTFFSFYFLSSLLGLIEQTLGEMCPGLLYERHAISPSHLCQHLIQPLSHPSHALLTVLLEQGIMGTVQASDGTLEYLHDVICLGSPDVVGSGNNVNGGEERTFKFLVQNVSIHFLFNY